MNRFRAGAGIPYSFVVLIMLIGLNSCNEPAETTPVAERQPGELFRVGSVVIHQADLTHHLQQHYAARSDDETRKAALQDLVRRAQFAQEAIDAGLASDPVLNAEVHRLLELRLRENRLYPQLQQDPEVSEGQLREIYASQASRFQSPETRQVAVLWLDSGPDPQKIRRCEKRLSEARLFALENKAIADHPEKGFSVLGADYSEHSASRFRGGMVGWLSREGTLDPWSKALAEIAFKIEEKGEISPVISRREGVFLVRLVDLKPAVKRPFEAVAPSLLKKEQARLRKELEQEFEAAILSQQPVEWADGE